MTGLDAVKMAQAKATASGQPFVVLLTPGKRIIVAPDGPLYGAKLLERCRP